MNSCSALKVRQLYLQTGLVSNFRGIHRVVFKIWETLPHSSHVYLPSSYICIRKYVS